MSFMYIQLSQENIFYEEYGEGKNIFLLLHNAGGNRRFFDYQIDILKNICRVIAIDLPGHGKSSANLPTYSIKEYADVIIQFCSKLGIEKINIIGLNNGANIAVEIANLNTSLVKNLILIDPPLFMNEHFIGEIKTFITQLSNSTLNEFIETLSFNSFIKGTEKTKKIAEAAFKAASPNILASIFSDLIEWDKTALKKIANLTIPVLCIITDEHHCAFNKLQSCNNKIEIGKVVYSRCWATLEVPEQVNPMILRFLEIQGFNQN